MPPLTNYKQDINQQFNKWKRKSLYFSSIFDSIHLSILITDNDGRIKLMNQPAIMAWEFDTECLNKPIMKLYWGPSQAKIEYYFTEAKNKGKRQTLECFPYVSQQGKEKFFQLDFVPLIDELNQVNGSMLIGTDITEKKRLEQERQVLEGLLPICSYCKKIRDHKNEWTVIEKYIKDRSQARFTHSICPDCLGENFPPS